MASTSIPKTMRRLALAESAGDSDFNKAKVVVEEVPVPTPSEGQVLVRMYAAPVNPSDYSSWARTIVPAGTTVPIGKEGSGYVVASGGGDAADALVGKKVGVTLMVGGSYGEYVVTAAQGSVFPLPEDLAVEDGASFFVNPYTVAGFLDTVKNKKHGGLVHTAAASQVGKMLVKICQEHDVTLINVVRKEAQAELLRGLGAKHIVVTSNDGWEKELKDLVKELGIKCAFDAIAGEMSGKLLTLLPPGGTYYVYGALSGQPSSGLNAVDLIYGKKKFEGFFLPTWLNEGGMAKMVPRIMAASKMVMPGLKDGWCATAFTDCTLDNMLERFLEMKNGGGFTDGKLRIRMDPPKEA